MSKLWILAAASLLAAPAAFAQPVYAPPPDRPAYDPGYPGPGAYDDRTSWDGDNAYAADRERLRARAMRRGHARLYRGYSEWGQPDETVVSNRPVPDTPRNRRRYPPLSNGGWRTAPAGD